MKALVTGATGLIGRHLLTHLPKPVALSRNPARARETTGAPVEWRQWAPTAEPATAAAQAGADVVFHLAGEPVGEGRWSTSKKRRIRESRVAGTRYLVAGLAAATKRPEVLIAASAVGYYGDRGDEQLTEASAAGDGFLANVCADWEREAMAAETLGIRVVCVRIGIVLAGDGGALAKMRPPFELGLGGRLGNGKQWMPWVHVDDVVGMLLHASRCDDLRGPINAVAPTPVTNADFTRAFGKAIGRPTFLAVPKTALRLAVGEMSHILLASQRVVPEEPLRSGYRFRYPRLSEALEAALDRSSASELRCA